MKTTVRRALLSFLSALILLSGTSCLLLGSRQAWRPPRPVAIKGENINWYNMMPSGMAWMTAAVWGGTGGLLVRDGDIVAGESSSGQGCWFVYERSDGASLEMREENGRLILSGKTISIAPEEIEGCWEWLDQASSNDLGSIRFLMLPEKLDENRLPTLRKLAAANPGLSLGIGSISKSMSAAALFNPRMLFLESSATAAELSGILAAKTRSRPST